MNKINNSPKLQMPEITKQLFNNKFLSDVQFSIEGKRIYAHSLELMKRSIVFEEQLLATGRETKLIPVNDVRLSSFYQFLRFIYTDECVLNMDNGFELLKLAVKYKVVALENRVVNSLLNWGPIKLLFFQYCINEKYEPAYRRISDIIATNLYSCLGSEHFLSICSNTMEAILKLNRIDEQVNENDLFNALANWIAHQSKLNGIEIAQQRNYFDKLIKLIRFPTMPAEEVLNCARAHPHLFTDSDFSTIFQQMASTTNINTPRLWVSTPREEAHMKYRRYKTSQLQQTRFTTDKAVQLSTIRIGNIYQEGYNGVISLLSFDSKSIHELFNFTFSSPNILETLMNFGESFELQPKTEYRLSFKYVPKFVQTDTKIDEIESRGRCQGQSVVCTSSSVKIVAASENLFEIIFR